MQRLTEACYFEQHEADGLRAWLTSAESIKDFHMTARMILQNTIAQLKSKVTRGAILDLFCRSMILGIDTVDFENIKMSYEIFVE